MGSRDEAAGWPGRCHRVPGRPGRLARHAARVLPTRRLPPPGGLRRSQPPPRSGPTHAGAALKDGPQAGHSASLCVQREGAERAAPAPAGIERAAAGGRDRLRARQRAVPPPLQPAPPRQSEWNHEPACPGGSEPSLRARHWLAFPATRPLPAVLAKGSQYLADHQRARRGVASGPGTPSCCRKCEPGLRPQDALGLSCVSWPAPARQNRKSLLNSSAERFSSRLTSADTVQNMVGSTRVSSNRGRINKTRCVPTVGR